MTVGSMQEADSTITPSQACSTTDTGSHPQHPAERDRTPSPTRQAVEPNTFTLYL